MRGNDTVHHFFVYLQAKSFGKSPLGGLPPGAENRKDPLGRFPPGAENINDILLTSKSKKLCSLMHYN